MKHHPLSVKSRYTHKTLAVIADDKSPLLTFFLATLRPQRFTEFIYLSESANNLLYKNTAGNYYYDIREYMMASPKDWKFVDVKLDKGQKAEVDLFGDQYDKDFLGIIDDISELGYKVSVSYIDKQNSYCVSVSGSERSGYNKNMTLTSWAGELGEAVKIAGYKVLDYMRNKDWVDFETSSETWG